MSDKDTLTLSDITGQAEVLTSETINDSVKSEKFKLIIGQFAEKLKSTAFAGIGILVFIGLGYLMSRDKNRIDWK